MTGCSNLTTVQCWSTWEQEWIMKDLMILMASISRLTVIRKCGCLNDLMRGAEHVKALLVKDMQF